MKIYSKGKKIKAVIGNVFLITSVLILIGIFLYDKFGHQMTEIIPTSSGLETALEEISFPQLDMAEEYKFKHCLAKYLPQYPDYVFSAVNKPKRNEVLVRIPLETIHPPKFHVLKSGKYEKPLEMRVGINTQHTKENVIEYSFSITSLFHGYSNQPDTRETQEIRIKRNTEINSWAGISSGSNNRLLSKHDSFSNIEEEAISLVYFYSMNIMRGIAGNVSECYFPKTVSDKVINAVDNIRENLKGPNELPPSTSEY